MIDGWLMATITEGQGLMDENIEHEEFLHKSQDPADLSISEVKSEKMVPDRLLKATKRPKMTNTIETNEQTVHQMHADVEKEMCRKPNVMPYCVALSNSEKTHQVSTNTFTCESCYNDRNTSYSCSIHSANQTLEAKINQHNICMHPQSMPMLIDLPKCVAVVKSKFHSLAELVAGCQHTGECRFILIEPYRVHFCPSSFNTTTFIFNECSLMFDTKQNC